MKIKEIDFAIRKVNSFYLRIILGLVLFLIYTRNNNVFEENVYLFYFLGYWSLHVLNFFFISDNHKGSIRVLLDLTIITIFLYGKDLSQTINFLPYFLLLFNVNSHSNRNSKILLFIILMHLSILLVNDFEFIESFHFFLFIFYGFILIFFIRRFIEYRFKIYQT